jgi:hypothetical protein
VHVGAAWRRGCDFILSREEWRELFDRYDEANKTSKSVKVAISYGKADEEKIARTDNKLSASKV